MKDSQLGIFLRIDRPTDGQTDGHLCVFLRGLQAAKIDSTAGVLRAPGRLRLLLSSSSPRLLVSSRLLLLLLLLLRLLWLCSLSLLWLRLLPLQWLWFCPGLLLLPLLWVLLCPGLLLLRWLVLGLLMLLKRNRVWRRDLRKMSGWSC